MTDNHFRYGDVLLVMRASRISVSAVLARVALLLAVSAGMVGAQTADVVRGRVTDDSSRAVVGATVSITRGPDRLIQQTITDSGGRYSSRFEPGTGDYLVNVSLLGFRTARRRVQREGGERELVADFTMARDLATLAEVKVTANRPVRASAGVSPTSVEAGANEQWANGVNGRLTPGMQGDLAALAGTMPGVTMTGSGPSILGAASTSNLTTLNGMALPGGSLPRAARTGTRVTGATFDATRGGSPAQTSMCALARVTATTSSATRTSRWTRRSCR